MEYKNKHGQVSLHTENNIIIAKFSGYVTSGLLRVFKAELCAAIELLKCEHWAYISDSFAVLAATPEAEQEMTNISHLMHANNCIASAFVLSSAIAINQMNRILNCAGKNANINDYLFTDLESAKLYISNSLNNKTSQVA
ncbi:hypothetical protein V6237_18970 [Pseudoalteromonas carrageenovora]|uniref:hypothetical protein n=1 Tax=Pseudoalteromonas TaxID=53246 RepID=UPI00311DF9B0